MWTTVATIKTNATTGTAVYHPPTSIPGAYSYRAAVAGKRPLRALVSSSRSITVINPVQMTQVVVGGLHTCGRGNDTNTYCWGGNADGQLGNGGTANQTAPIPVNAPAGATFTRLAAGRGHTCALGSDTNTYCWGSGSDGQLGNGATAKQTAPAPVHAPAGVTFTQLAAGEYHTCALGSDEQTYCWGSNTNFQLGNGGTARQTSPGSVHVPDGVTFTQLAAGAYHTCALADDTETYCWGSNTNSQLGNGDATDQATPVPVHAPAGVTLTQLAAGDRHTCALGSNTETYCWGWGISGQLGNGTTGQSTNHPIPEPVIVPAGVIFTQLAAGRSHTCALGSDSQTYCWGWGSYGQLGGGATGQLSSQSVPALVNAPAGVTFTQLAAGEYHTCALGSNARTYCWGLGADGQLGYGSTAGQLSPIAVFHPSGRPSPDPTPAPDPSPDPVPDDPTPPIDDDPGPAPQPDPAPRPNPTPPPTKTVSVEKPLTSTVGSGSFRRTSRVDCPSGWTAISGSGSVIYAEGSLQVSLVGSHQGRPPSTWITEWDLQNYGSGLVGNARVRLTAVCLRP
ncbi:RCC1 domain-containing protein [Actinoplanes sichuanensis]|uniref:RCC1 domain-containing protein n=1 Tax=Actinoplanes sichuanensis TaxID=512349 RepID=A0ABW4AIV7_9ACTN|nr:hypothetical protein [Actinoplanes sichuanensis]